MSGLTGRSTPCNHHDAPVAAENRAIVRDIAVVPGTQAAWSVGVGILSAAPDGRARIELYGSISQ